MGIGHDKILDIRNRSQKLWSPSHRRNQGLRGEICIVTESALRDECGTFLLVSLTQYVLSTNAFSASESDCLVTEVNRQIDWTLAKRGREGSSHVKVVCFCFCNISSCSSVTINTSLFRQAIYRKKSQEWLFPANDNYNVLCARSNPS